MKVNSITKVTFFSMFLLLGSACTKETEFTHENYFQVNNELKIILTNGFITDYGLIRNPGMADVYKMTVDFLDQGVDYNLDTHKFEGTGSRLNIAFHAPEDNQVSSGVYHFDNESVNPDPYTFYAGFVEENYNYTSMTGHHHNITGGTILVVYDGEKYDVTFNCSLDTGSDFVGTYLGVMTYHDFVP